MEANKQAQNTSQKNKRELECKKNIDWVASG